MKCPRCGAKLKRIQEGEWICTNEDCPENKGYQTYAEFYGNTQKEIDDSLSDSKTKR